MRLDKNITPEDAVVEIYKVLRPGEPPNIETAFEVFNSLFFKTDKYDLSDVGRVKMNFRLNLDCPDDVTVLRSEDVIAVIKTVTSSGQSKFNLKFIFTLPTSDRSYLSVLKNSELKTSNAASMLSLIHI